MTEACWPTFKSFEAKRKRVLARCKSVALINHGLTFGEHVPGFKILHFEIPVAWSFYKFGSVIIAGIILGFDIRNLNILDNYFLTSL